MAQLEEAAGESNEPVDAGNTDPLEDFADALGLDEDGNDPEEEDEDESEGGDPEESDEQEEEPEETPAIDPPVSWKADAKELFKTLPPEAQKVIAERETERERFVQQKAQEAATTRQSVENEARQAFAQLQQQTASQLQQYAQQLTPQRPDPAMLQYDPQGFYAEQAKYESAIAQRTEAQQMAAQYEAQARQHQEALTQAELQQDVQVLQASLPEWFDPSSSADLQQKLTATARELGYSPDHVQQARAVDIIAMKKVADVIAERDALKAQVDGLNKAKMANVRAAKTLPKVAKPGVARNAPDRSARADAAWQNVKSARSSEQKYGAFADFLDNSGML